MEMEPSKFSTTTPASCTCRFIVMTTEISSPEPEARPSVVMELVRGTT